MIKNTLTIRSKCLQILLVSLEFMKLWRHLFQTIYILTYEGQYSFTEIYNLPAFSVCHVDDVINLLELVFGSFGWNPETHVLTGDDVEVSNFMVSAWANFGDPTPPSDRLEST